MYIKLMDIKNSAGNREARRIASELLYAAKLSETQGHRFDGCIESAADELLRERQAVGAITRQAAMACEERLCRCGKRPSGTRCI